MKCMYCGRDNPDDATFCECGRPLRLGGASSTPSYTSTDTSPFASQTLADVKYKKPIPKAPLLLLLLIAVGVGVFFLLRFLSDKKITDEGSWETISKPFYSITVPSSFKEGDMLTVGNSVEVLLDFYTSRLAGFDVSKREYTAPEKEMYGSLTARDFAEAQQIRTVKINGQEVKYQVREGHEYIYGEFSRHCINYIGKTDDLWYIEAMFPTKNAYYLVNVYCAEEDKAQYRDAMMKWLDSFTPKD